MKSNNHPKYNLHERFHAENQLLVEDIWQSIKLFLDMWML